MTQPRQKLLRHIRLQRLFVGRRRLLAKRMYWCAAVFGGLNLCTLADFNISSDLTTARSPDVAFDTSAERHFVVWEQDGHIKGQFRSADGAWQGDVSIFDALGDVSYLEPAVTFKSTIRHGVTSTSTQDMYFVVATQKTMNDIGHDVPPYESRAIVVQRLDESGARLGAQIVLEPGVLGENLGRPDIEADTYETECCVLVAWEERAKDKAIRGQRLRADGTLSGDSFQIAGFVGSHSQAFNPSMAYQHKRDHFMMVYEVKTDGTGTYVASKTVPAYFGAPSTEQELARKDSVDPRGASPEGFPDVAHNELRDRYLVTWHDDGAPYAHMMTGSGEAIGASYLLCNEGPMNPWACFFNPVYDAPAVAPLSTDFMTVHGRRNLVGNTTRLVGYRTSDSWVFSEFTVTTPDTAEPRRPVLSYSPISNNFLVVWESDYRTIKGEILMLESP